MHAEKELLLLTWLSMHACLAKKFNICYKILEHTGTNSIKSVLINNSALVGGTYNPHGGAVHTKKHKNFIKQTFNGVRSNEMEYARIFSGKK